MDFQIKKILTECDDPIGAETPTSDWSNLSSEKMNMDINGVREALRLELNLVFELDGCVQDASFYDELRILNKRSFQGNGGIAIISDIAIRFSNFGRLCTVWSNTGQSLRGFPLIEIISILKRFDWRYIPAVEMDEIYDGINQALNDGKNTWWVRYFDYL